jgi:predicted O-linked N-acetylglucosamine transferase (SPINDLY family)
VLVDREQLFAEALAAQSSGDLARAEQLYRQLLAVDPDQPSPLVNLASVLTSTQRAREALELLAHAVAIAPDHANAHSAKGLAHQQLAELDEAEACFARALAIDERHLGALNNWAMVCSARRQSERAFELYRRALQVDPDCLPALQNLGVLFTEVGKLSEAEACYQRGLAVDPKSGPMHCNLANVLCRRGRAAEALGHLGQALAACPHEVDWHSNLLLTLHYLEGPTREEVFREHRRWARLRRADRFHLPPKVDDARERRLRIGYVSPDFRAHAVAFFIAPILREHDRESFEIIAYANVQAPDAFTDKLRGLSDAWHNVFGIGDEELAERVRRDRIDVLVDLAGHTAGHRLLTFALAPAPLQLTYLGYPDTTGVASIGYRLTDAICDPPGSEAFHTESLLRIPGGMHCYEPPSGAPEVSDAPVTRRGHLTFGSFNNTCKITGSTVARWARVLRAVPDSRMWMKFPTLADERTADAYRAAFAQHGVDPARVTMRGSHYDHGDHLAEHAEVDVILDAFPYNGTTTTCEALWMGVPVLSRVGDRHVARVGKSLLSQVRLDHFACDDDEALVAVATRLASPTGVAELVALRATLRYTMIHSPLCDAAYKARAIEAAIRDAWQGRGSRPLAPPE